MREHEGKGIGASGELGEEPVQRTHLDVAEDFLAEYRDARVKDRHTQRWNVVIALAAVAGVVVALAGVLSDVSANLEQLTSTAEGVRRDALVDRLVIVAPIDGDSVERTDVVRAATPFLTRNHFVVVTSMTTGGEFVQEGPLSVSATGVLAGRATFGTTAVGAGESYMIRVMSTSENVLPGPLLTAPEDALWSNPIAVTRTN